MDLGFSCFLIGRDGKYFLSCSLDFPRNFYYIRMFSYISFLALCSSLLALFSGILVHIYIIVFFFFCLHQHVQCDLSLYFLGSLGMICIWDKKHIVFVLFLLNVIPLYLSGFPLYCWVELKLNLVVLVLGFLALGHPLFLHNVSRLPPCGLNLFISTMTR